MLQVEFLVSLSYPSKREFKLFRTHGKSRFSRMSIEIVHFQLRAMTRSRMVPST